LVVHYAKTTTIVKHKQVSFLSHVTLNSVAPNNDISMKTLYTADMSTISTST